MAIKITNLSKAYDDKVVLNGFNLTLEKGITSIMGASGSGKTTLVNILAGFIKPDKGEMDIPPDTRFSFVFQEDRLLEWETSLANVLFVRKDPKEATPKAIELLTQADLESSIQKKARELSGGMKRRVAICRALIADYDVLILDEPFKGLDAGIKPKIMQMVKNNAKNKYVLVITHDPSEVEFLGGKVVDILSTL